MYKKILIKSFLIIFVLALAACGGLRFSQVYPEAKDFHPKRIAIFPVEVVGNYEEARISVEQVVAGVLAENKLFSDIVDAGSLNRQIQTNEELRKTISDYLSKLRMVNFSDEEMSKKIGELVKVDAFLMVSVDTWSYTVEKTDKVAKVSLGMKLYEAETGKIMWKADHEIVDSYTLFKPALSKVARDVSQKMIAEMPH
jgi:hypothetical protein